MDVRRLAFAAVVLLLLSPVADARRRAVAPPAAFTVPAADAVAARALQAGVPGLTIAVRRGDSFFFRAYGLANREAGVAATVQTEYQIASVSKQFTAAAIMRLVERGTLQVGDPARKWLPELDERFDAITIHHLLTHTSGVRDYSSQLTTAWEPKTQQEIVALITSGPPKFTPGSDWEYSNSGYFLLGMIIERASGMSYAQYLRETFFEPLAMHATSYCGTGRPSPDGYFFNATDGSVVPIRAADMSLVFAAGALCSTAPDLVRWTVALATHAAVSAESYALMTTDFNPDQALRFPYGYGLSVMPLDGRRRIWHNGSILGFQSHVAHYPEEDLTIVVLTNATFLFRDLATETADALARALADQSP